MLAALLAPMVVLVSSSRGETRVPVRLDARGGPVLAAPLLLPAVGGRAVIGEGWADVTVGPRTFRFILGAPLFRRDGKLQALVGSASLRRDTLQLPIQFVSEILPRALGDRFRYDPRLARLVDGAPAGVAAGGRPRGPPPRPGPGGSAPGSPGLFFPNGLREKDVTLQLSLLVRDELAARGVKVVMTRRTDTLIDLRSRGSYCTDSCDLFVSIHVNSLPRRTGYQRVRGFETYFLAEAKTEDAARVARMENEAIRFEGSGDAAEQPGGLDFILKDLQLNEHLRESARAAELVQSYLQESHTGPDLGVKQAGFMVLTTARRPAILIETGYSTNPEDARLPPARASQKNLAASIADAVVAYLLEYERKVGLGPRDPAVAGRSSK